jgi:uncharacterized protein (TIGR02099 family)
MSSDPSQPERPEKPLAGSRHGPHRGWRQVGHRTVRVAGYVLASVVVTAALLVSLLRLLVPMVPDYKQDIEEWVGEMIDARVRVESIDAGWRGLGPGLILQGVALIDPQSNLPFLRFSEVEVTLNPWASLLTGTPQTGHLRLKGGRLNILRTAEGRLLVRGMSTSTTVPVASESGPVLAWLLSQSSLGLQATDIHFEDRTHKEPVLYRFSDVSVWMKNSGTQHRLKAEIRLPEDLGERAELRLRFTGRVESPQSWQGDLYLSAEDIRVADLGRIVDNPWLKIGSGQASVRLWGSWREQTLDDLRLEFLARDLSLQRKTVRGQAPLAEIGRASGVVDIRRRSEREWRVELRGFETAWLGGRTTPVDGTLRVRYERETGQLDLEGMIDRLRVQEWTPYAGLLVLPESSTGEWLRRLSPEGELSHLRFTYTGDVSGPETFAAAAGFEDLSLRGGTEGVPSLEGLDGSFEMRGSDAVVQLRTKDASVDFHGYFRRPMQADSLSGELRLRARPGAISVSSGDILIRNEDIDGRVRLAMDIEPGVEPFLDLRAHVYRARGASTYRYLPVGSLDAPIVAWLDRAITDGRGYDVNLLYYGRLGDFLDYDESGNGRFEVRFKVDDATLDYFERWPPIKAERALITFVNESMSARIVRGEALGVTISNGSVKIPDLSRAVVHIEAEARGDVGRMLEFVRHSPLEEKFARVVADSQATGQGDLRVAIVIPVSHRTAADLDVEVALEVDDASLRSADRHLALTSIDGRFVFTEQGVEADAVRARLFDADVRVDIGGRQQQTGRWTTVRLRGELPVQGLADALGSPWFDRMRGRAPWDITVAMAHASEGEESRVKLHLESSLQGIEVDLPAPLRKGAGSVRRLLVDADLRNGTLMPVRLSLGEDLRGVIQVAHSTTGGWSASRAAISFGGGRPVLPRSRAWDLKGSLERLSLSEWSGFLAELPGGRVAQTAVDRLGAVNLTIVSMEALGYELGAAHVASRKVGDQVRIRMNSPRGEGLVIIPSSAQPGAPITATFERLQMVRSDVERSGNLSDPRDWPPIRASVGRLETQEHQIEDLRLELTPERKGIRLHLLSLQAYGLTLRIEGDWVMLGDSRQRSDFRIEAQSADIGKALDQLGLSQAIVGGEAQATAKLRWPNAPFAFGWEGLRGEAKIKIEKGSLRDIDPKAGRLIGLFSIEALPRRLALDFDDIGGKGFVFDSIEGSLSITGPQIYTKDFTIKGRSARIDLSGRVGVLARDYDQLVTVTPKVDATLPVAGAIAGGTGVGAVVLIIQQAFKRPIERSMQFKYTVTGSWDDPQIERIQAPDDFESDRKLGPTEYE